MKNNFYYPSSDKLTQIHAIEWIPEGEIKAVLQISHGMVEYIDRYDRFARYLNENGIYVVGNDHLGHGESVVSDDKHGYFAKENGNWCVIEDINELRRITGEKYPDKPYFMLGHSMGSFLIRQYMMIYGQGLSGVIVMGTGSQPAATLKGAKAICKTLSAFKGWEHRSSFLNNMAFAAYNKKFEPARTRSDWLTKDEAIIDSYNGDPWCSFIFTLNGFFNMFNGIEYIQNPSNIKNTPKDYPILLVSGADDPVGDFGKGVKTAYDAYIQNGITNVEMKLYENDRHELINETDYEKVYSDLKEWIEKGI